MKDDILFVTFRMTPPFFLGGAEVSQRILAERLNAAGYKVYCIGSYAHPVRNTWDSLPAYCNQLKKLNIPFEFIGPGSDLSYSYKGVFCTMVPQEKIIDKLKQKLEEGVRIVFSWLEHSDEIINLSAENGIDTVAWIQDVLPVGLSALRAKPTFVLYTSKFVHQLAKKLFCRDGFVFYPPFDNISKFYINKRKHKVITLINPIPEKGIDTFLELSIYFRDFLFLTVEGWRPVKIDERYLKKNVKYIPRRNNLTSIYRQTRILLVPSHFEEGFGRTVTEAALHGVPAIASNRGGLIEAVGKGGVIINSHEVKEWIDAVKMVDDVTNYEKLCIQARRHAKFFLRDPISQLLEMGILS